MTVSRNRICVTPTRNESWIIKQFLAAAQLWADHIVVADQGSADGILQQLQCTPGVNVVINASTTYAECHRQRLLLETARRIQGPRLLLGLDADEALSANCLQSADWKRIQDAPPGAVLRFRWVNILPGFKEAWIPPGHVHFGFVDDGSDHAGRTIHSPRVPCPPNAPVIDLDDVVVLHFQYVLWERMMSKQRWYQSWEHAKHRRKSALDIFREYNHMRGGWERGEIHPVRPEWLDGYEANGVSFRSLTPEPITWWDQEVVAMLRENGPAHFRKVAIWDKDWNAVATQLNIRDVDLRDPRSVFEKITHRLLTVTQRRRSNWGVRGFERLLRLAGW